MTTALDRTPQIGETWFFPDGGQVWRGQCICVESQGERRIYLQPRSGQTICVPRAICFSQSSACKKYLGIQKPSIAARLSKAVR